MRKTLTIMLSLCLCTALLTSVPDEKTLSSNSKNLSIKIDEGLNLESTDSSPKTEVKAEVLEIEDIDDTAFLSNSDIKSIFAEAGEDQEVYEGDVVQFNGTGSTGVGIINVLHISVYKHNELQMIIDYTGSTDRFVVTQVGLSEFNNGNPDNLSWFDVIVFGLSNHYEEFSVPIERTTELRDYVINGGGIVWTHDTLEYYYDYGPDLEEPAGMDFNSSNPTTIGLHIPNTEIIMDHEILHNLFEIGNVGDIIQKTPYPPPWYHYTHTGGGNVTTADIIIQHDTTPGSLNFYLTTHEYGQGRVALDEIGHTVISGDGVFLGLPSQKECQILVNAIFWVAKGGTTSLNYSWDFDSNVDSDGDGDPSNDIDETGPTPTHIYGDDGRYTVTLTVTDNRNMSDSDICNITVFNLEPSTTIESATMNVEIGLRVAGRKYNDVGMTLYEEGNPIGYVSIERQPGSPNAQMAWVPVNLDMTKAYSATVTFTPEDPPDIGANPVWIYIKFEDGSIEKIHHTFNVQQSKKRDSDHWNHAEPWEVDLNAHLIGHELSLKVTAEDPGSDDLMFQWNSIVVITFYNNGISPDPYPSPWGTFPFLIEDIISCPYSGPGTYTLTVIDDDGGLTSVTIDLA